MKNTTLYMYIFVWSKINSFTPFRFWQTWKVDVTDYNKEKERGKVGKEKYYIYFQNTFMLLFFFFHLSTAGNILVVSVADITEYKMRHLIRKLYISWVFKKFFILLGIWENVWSKPIWGSSNLVTSHPQQVFFQNIHHTLICYLAEKHGKIYPQMYH